MTLNSMMSRLRTIFCRRKRAYKIFMKNNTLSLLVDGELLVISLPIRRSNPGMLGFKLVDVPNSQACVLTLAGLAQDQESSVDAVLHFPDRASAKLLLGDLTKRINRRPVRRVLCWILGLLVAYLLITSPIGHVNKTQAANPVAFISAEPPQPQALPSVNLPAQPGNDLAGAIYKQAMTAADQVHRQQAFPTTGGNTPNLSDFGLDTGAKKHWCDPAMAFKIQDDTK